MPIQYIAITDNIRYHTCLWHESTIIGSFSPDTCQPLKQSVPPPVQDLNGAYSNGRTWSMLYLEPSHQFPGMYSRLVRCSEVEHCRQKYALFVGTRFLIISLSGITFIYHVCLKSCLKYSSLIIHSACQFQQRIPGPLKISLMMTRQIKYHFRGYGD